MNTLYSPSISVRTWSDDDDGEDDGEDDDEKKVKILKVKIHYKFDLGGERPSWSSTKA